MLPSTMDFNELPEVIQTLQDILRAVKYAKKKGMLGIERDEETLERCIEFFKKVQERSVSDEH